MAYVNRRRGLGLANCPSLKQLQGIVDLSDPCQASISASGDTVVGPGGGIVSFNPPSGLLPPTCMPGDSLVSDGAGNYICQPGALGFMDWLKANPLAMVGAGLALVVVLGGAFGGGGGRRR